MKKVEIEDIKKVLQRTSGAGKEKLAEVVQFLKVNQPGVLNYLENIAVQFLNEKEKRCFLFMGINIWQMMVAKNTGLKKITMPDLDEKIRQAVTFIKNIKTEDDFKNIVEESQQPEVLNYVLTSLESIHNLDIRPQNKTVIFFFLKALTESFQTEG
jgi:hypothetical protein